MTLSWDGEDVSAHIAWPDGAKDEPLGASNLQGAKGLATRHMTQAGYTGIKKWRKTRAHAAAAAELPSGVVPRSVPLWTREYRQEPSS